MDTDTHSLMLNNAYQSDVYGAFKKRYTGNFFPFKTDVQAVKMWEVFAEPISFRICDFKFSGQVGWKYSITADLIMDTLHFRKHNNRLLFLEQKFSLIKCESLVSGLSWNLPNLWKSDSSKQGWKSNFDQDFLFCWFGCFD